VTEEIDVDQLLAEAHSHPLWEDFLAYDDDNPHVFDALVAQTREHKRQGRPRTAINRLVQDLRWDNLGPVNTAEPVKLPNAFAPLYARAIAFEHPELAHMFKYNALSSKA